MWISVLQSNIRHKDFRPLFARNAQGTPQDYKWGGLETSGRILISKMLKLGELDDLFCDKTNNNKKNNNKTIKNF